MNFKTRKIKDTSNYIPKLKMYTFSKMHKSESINRCVCFISYTSLFDVSPQLPMYHLPGV